MRARKPRPAFTLIELLIVVMIIGILAALTVGAAMRFMGGSLVSSTRTTMDRIALRVGGQASFFRDHAGRSTIPQTIKDLAKSSAGVEDDDRAKALFIKFRMKQAFPQSIYEALYPGRDPNTGVEYIEPLPAYVRELAKYGYTRNPDNYPTTVSAEESAACLLMALRYGPEATGEEEIGVRGAVQSTTALNGMPFLADAWGTPLVFCRWPVGDHSGSPPSGASLANPSGYAAGSNDPGDPRGTLNDADWQNSANGQAFQRTCHYLYPRADNTVATATLNLSMVLMSAGPDKAVGADFFTLASTGAASNDNIIAARIR